MTEANQIYEELKKLNKKIDSLPTNVLWSEVQTHLKDAINIIKKDKRIYGW